jgi:hypothetical protein
VGGGGGGGGEEAGNGEDWRDQAGVGTEASRHRGKLWDLSRRNIQIVWNCLLLTGQNLLSVYLSTAPSVRK